jgi:hypothetical protein
MEAMRSSETSLIPEMATFKEFRNFFPCIYLFKATGTILGKSGRTMELN